MKRVLLAASMPPELARGGLVTAVVGGRFHGLALLTNGSVLGWDKAPSARLLPLPVGRVATQVAAGYWSSFVVLDNGALLAWGSLNHTANSRANWTAWATSLHSASIVSVAAGSDHVVVALSNGTIAGFGENIDGQLNFPPKLIQSGAEVLQVAAGSHNTLALTSDGRVHAFGSNMYNLSSLPASVRGHAVRKVGTGLLTNYALLEGGDVSSGGQLLSWGRHYGLQALQGLTNIVDFAAGGYHVAVRLATGEVRDFGEDGLGQVRTGWWEACHLHRGHKEE
jgi:alpha-tubulin suppressor-like RCC1 family protein